MPDHRNIIVGAALLKVDGVDVGYTQGGVTQRYAPEFFDVSADQLAGIARKEKISEKMTVGTTMLETTLENLRKAMGHNTSHAFSGSALTIGEASPVVTEHVLTIIGKAPNGGTRTVTYYRAISVDEIEHMIGARDQASILPVSFECLKDPAYGNSFCKIIDT